MALLASKNPISYAAGTELTREAQKIEEDIRKVGREAGGCTYRLPPETKWEIKRERPGAGNEKGEDCPRLGPARIIPIGRGESGTVRKRSRLVLLFAIRN